MSFGRKKENKTIFGISIPNGFQEKDQSEVSIWNGIIPFENPENVEEIIPKNTLYREDIISLVKDFINHHKLNTRNNTSYSILLVDLKSNKASLLHIQKDGGNTGRIKLCVKPPEKTISRHYIKGRVVIR